MKTAIIYFSHSGNNKLLAQHYQEHLDSDLYQVTEPGKRNTFTILMDMLFNRNPKVNPLNIDLDSYQYVLLIAPIWNLNIAHPMKTFVKQNKEGLHNFSFATICIGRDGQEQAIKKQFIKLLKRAPDEVFQYEINSLVPPEHRDKPKYVSRYKVTADDIYTFNPNIGSLSEYIHTKAEESVDV